jgi:two-component system, cell cycle sensor histidine kinase and response regulator CckA
MTGAEVSTGGMRRAAGDPLLRARDERLESLKAVAGKLAHDFNNFLVPQFGYVALLKEEMPGESGSAQYLSAMETATKRTESYIESILLAMRPERQLSVEEFSLDAVVNDALARWSAEAAPGMMVEVKHTVEPCTITGDAKHWRNAVGQLLGNARYALATGGRLEVELARKQLPGEEIVRLGLNTDDVYGLTVRDSGFGMSSSVAQRAFEPFFTTRTQIKAPGLGLTIVHSVAQVHGGQVELRSAEEQGTTVTVWIPANGFDARQVTGSGRAARPGPGVKKKVLLIEDDPLVKEVLRDWLGRMGLEVHIAGAPEEADRMMKTWGAELSLVITETDLRGGKGEELYARLAEVNEGLPWIFLAGKRKPEIPEGVAEGTLAPLIMQKPVTLRTLAEVVRRHAAG